MQYQGSQGYLSAEERAEVVTFLQTQEYYSVDALRDYIDEHSAVVSQSKQSYYDLVHEAHIGWKKTEKVHPARDDGKVLAKRAVIKKHEKTVNRRLRRANWWS